MRLQVNSSRPAIWLVVLLLAATVCQSQVAAKNHHKNQYNVRNSRARPRPQSGSSLSFKRSFELCGAAPAFDYPRSPSDLESGHELFAGEFPSYIEFWSADGEHICAGALVNPQRVMTSANCARLIEQTGSVSAVGGTSAMRHHGRQSSFMQQRNLAKLCKLKGANVDNYGNKDLAVVQLEREFNLTNYVRTACLEGSESKTARNIESCYFVSRGSSQAVRTNGETYPVVVPTTMCIPNKKEPKRDPKRAQCAEISNKTKFPDEVCPVASADSDQWSGYPLYCINRSQQYLAGVGSHSLTRKKHPCQRVPVVDERKWSIEICIPLWPGQCITKTTHPKRPTTVEPTDPNIDDTTVGPRDDKNFSTASPTQPKSPSLRPLPIPSETTVRVVVGTKRPPTRQPTTKRPPTRQPTTKRPQTRQPTTKVPIPVTSTTTRSSSTRAASRTTSGPQPAVVTDKPSGPQPAEVTDKPSAPQPAEVTDKPSAPASRSASWVGWYYTDVAMYKAAFNEELKCTNVDESPK